MTGLLADCADPMVQHQLDPTQVRRAWLAGTAVVVEHGVSWPDAPHGATALLCLGTPSRLDPLVAAVADVVTDPWRVVVETSSEAALPPTWRPADPTRWHWMTTRTAPDRPATSVVELTGPDALAEVEALRERADPARLPIPTAECWYAVREAGEAGEAGEVVAAGALVRHRDGTGQLRAITTAPAHRGRGHATDVSARLTRRALEGGSGVATLGVYTDNLRAIAVYRRLGYDVAHTLASGLVGPTSARV